MDCEVEAGRTTRFDLDLRGQGPAAVRGTFLVNGEPASGWTVTLTPTEGPRAYEEPPSKVLDASGTFELQAPRGTCSLRLSSPQGSAARSEWREVLDLGVGDLDWEGELRGAPVSGVSARGPNPLLFEWHGPDGALVLSQLTPDQEGHFDHPLIPVGAARIGRAGTNPKGDPWQVLPGLVVPPEGLEDVVLE